MIIHLESGQCDSGVSRLELNRTAARCYQWKHFVFREYRDDLLAENDGFDIYHTGCRAFECPSCITSFTRLSGMFQHIESDSCNASLKRGIAAKLVRWLRNVHN